MSQSYAGITVPEGEPGALRAAASQFGTIAGTLSGISGELRAMPGTMASWQGPASVCYAGSCMTGGAEADAAVQALGTAEQAARRYAEALKEAQDDAKRAIEQAKEAQQRIDQAERDISDAQGRQTAAWQAADAAAMEIALSSATGSASPGALEAQSQAWAAADAATADEARARRELDRARDDLERAEERGREAEEAARDAARAAAGAFGGAAMGSPAFAAFGPAAMAAAASGDSLAYTYFHKPFNPFHPDHSDYERGRVWWDYGSGVMIGGAGQAARYLSLNWWRHEPGYWARQPTWIAPYTRSTPSGGTTTVRGHYRGGQWVGSQVVPDEAARAQWASRARWIGRGGNVLAFGAAGLDQWVEDSGRTDLTTTDRVGRTAGATAFVGSASVAGGIAGAWAGAKGGAALGGAIGSIIPGAGTAAGAAVGGAIGAVVGGIAGSGLAGAAASEVKDFAVDLGQGAANLAVDGWNEGVDLAEGAWEKTEGPREWAGEALDTITPDIDLTPDVDLTPW